MSNKLLKTIDGRNLYYTFLAGAEKIFKHQEEINSINVFPVSDHDTGTNLASTIRSVTNSLQPQQSITNTATHIAESALIGARGNSGIIFAQFLYGFSTEIADKQKINFSELAESLCNSVKHVYQAVTEPVEGTMLTVMREWTEYLYQSKEKYKDLRQAMIESLDILHKSLEETKYKLGVLTKNNVVDAGAKGFVLFMEGVFDLIRKGNIRQLRRDTNIVIENSIQEPDITDQDLKHRFCTEALIKDISIDNDKLKKKLNQFGNSIVVAGSKRLKRIHVHTNEPSMLFEDLKESGTLTYQKADDMLRQHQVVHNRKFKIAIVTDSTCDLDEMIFDKYQIHMLPINLNFGENHYLDKLTIKPHQFYHLLDTYPDFPTTSQINEHSFFELYSRLINHYDSVFAIHLSSKFSGTFESSCNAAKKMSIKSGKKISVIDSRNLSGGLGILVLRMAEAIESGITHQNILDSIDTWIENTRIFVSVKTLDYMVRGGRVSYAKGKVAKLLNINPTFSIDKEGKSALFDKSSSQKKNMKKVMKTIINETGDKRIWKYIVMHAQNPDAAEWYCKEMEKLTGMSPVSKVDIAPVIGMHAGIGAAAVSFMLE